jgi:hypothetical protein
MDLAWIVLGARLVFAVALRAHVKEAFGIVVACQVAWRIGTPCAELDPHVRPPEAGQQTSTSSQVRLAGGAHMCRALGSSRLFAVSLAGIVDIVSPAIGSSD